MADKKSQRVKKKNKPDIKNVQKGSRASERVTASVSPAPRPRPAYNVVIELSFYIAVHLVRHAHIFLHYNNVKHFPVLFCTFVN